VSDQDPRK